MAIRLLIVFFRLFIVLIMNCVIEIERCVGIFWINIPEKRVFFF